MLTDGVVFSLSIDCKTTVCCVVPESLAGGAANSGTGTFEGAVVAVVEEGSSDYAISIVEFGATGG